MRYLLMLLFCLPLMASAVEFDEFTQSLPLGRSLQVFEDPSGQASIADVRAQARFHRIDSGKAVEREKARLVKLHQARILVRDQAARIRRPDDLGDG